MSKAITAEQRHYIMSRIHSDSTKPEIELRHALWHRGFRYRKNVRHLPGSPDIVLPKYKSVIFVHGCFWHAHQGCFTFRMPRTNSEYWEKKITRNQARDQEVWRQLEAQGWAVIIVWECQLKKANLNDTLDLVETEIKRNGEIHRSTQEDRRRTKEAYRQERQAQKARESELKTAINRHS